MDGMLSITVNGPPIAQARPKFRSMKSKGGKTFGMAYNPQETEAGRFTFNVAKQLPENFQPIQGPLSVIFLFSMPIPASASKKRRAAMVAGEIAHTKTPDASNMVKFVEDCLNGILWADDSQIVEISAVKFYGEEPKTTIAVKQI